MLPLPDTFLHRLFDGLPGQPEQYDHLPIDHICYRVKTLAAYEELRTHLATDNELLTESPIGGRPIAVFRLREPYRYGERRVELLELPAPKPGRPYPAGWEHLEFVTDRPLAAFADWLVATTGLDPDDLDRSGMGKASNPDLRLRLAGGLSVKFHEQPLDAVIRAERAAEKK